MPAPHQSQPCGKPLPRVFLTRQTTLAARPVMLFRVEEFILRAVEHVRGKRVPTSTLEAGAAPAARDAFEMNVAAERPERRIVWTGAISAGVHLLLLLAIGVAAVESRRPSAAPELRVYLEAQDLGRDEEHDRAGPTEAPAAPAEAREALLSATTPSRSSGVRSRPRSVAPTAPQLPDTPTAVPTGEGLAGGDSSSEAVAVLTTTGVSNSEALESAAPVPPPAGIDIPTAQQSVLTRWVMQAAEKFKDANLRQARLSMQHEGRQYVASLERRPAADNMDIERVRVEVTTEENGRRLHTRLEMKRLAFSHYAQLVDWWDPDVQFHDDEIVGRFHSNSRINVGYDRAVAPRFLAVVTTAAPDFTLGNTRGHRRNDEIFRGGLKTRAGHIALPSKYSPPGPEEAGSGAPSQSFTHDTRIVFYGDGSYGWRELGAGRPEHRQVMSTPAYIVGARRATLLVRGTVNGKVLIYSPEHIVIEGSLVYAHDPRATAAADDYLGLLCDKDIEIAPPKVTGPGDLEIQAAVYARRRFVVTDEDVPGHGTLLIYGSLTAGSLSATEPRYATRYEFDPRFEHERPPGFPMTERYEIESWEAQWQEAGDEPPGKLAEAPSPPDG